jgi:formylglycine-generating enzyme required for sulfatase activity
MILSLGGFTGDQLSLKIRENMLSMLLGLYHSDPDVGIHSAIEWLLCHSRAGLRNREFDWGQAETLRHIDEELAGKWSADRNWAITKEGNTMAIIHGPVEFTMGAPRYEPGKDKDNTEAQHRERIPRTFAISTKEVTVGEFQRFLDENPEIKRHARTAGKKDPTREGPTLQRLHLDDDCPQVMITWFEAAQYCNWLSQKENISQSAWCYPPLEEIKEGMDLPPDYLSRTGYRLPTDAEWEYACRAGAMTSRFFGSTEELLPEYAWYTGDTFNERPWPVGQLKPNDFGLFDMYGNVWEWIGDLFKQYDQDSKQEDQVDPVRTVSKEYERLRRGGSFTYAADFLRSAHRNHYVPDERRDSVGFRIARTVF